MTILTRVPMDSTPIPKTSILTSIPAMITLPWLVSVNSLLRFTSSTIPLMMLPQMVTLVSAFDNP